MKAEGPVPVLMSTGSDGPSSSSLRSRLEAFLPVMGAANDELLRQRAADPSSVDIEALTHPDAPHIEMVNATITPTRSCGVRALARMRHVPL